MVVLASFVEGEGGAASDAYALRWCLFHMKRSSNENEAVAVACSLSYVRKRSAGDIVSFVADLRSSGSGHVAAVRLAWSYRDTYYRRALHSVEQLWQRLTPRANAESSPAARRLADDSKRVASKLLALGRAADGSDGGGWGGAVSDRGRSMLFVWRHLWIQRRASRGLFVVMGTNK